MANKTNENIKVAKEAVKNWLKKNNAYMNSDLINQVAKDVAEYVESGEYQNVEFAVDCLMQDECAIRKNRVELSVANGKLYVDRKDGSDVEGYPISDSKAYMLDLMNSICNEVFFTSEAD